VQGVSLSTASSIAVHGVSSSTALSMDVYQGVSPSTDSRMDVQVVFLSSTVGMDYDRAWCIPFHHRSGSMCSTMDLHGVSLSTTNGYALGRVCPFPTPAMCACKGYSVDVQGLRRTYFSPCKVFNKMPECRTVRHQRSVWYRQCGGSGMFIPDPTFFHPGSQIRTVSIPDPGSGSRILIKEFKHFNPQTSKKMVSKL
jgi:hypothetical protein